MKHTLKITLLLALIFFVSQVIGLAVTNEYIDHKTTVEKKEPVHKDLPLGIARPEVEGKGGIAVITIVSAVLIGTLFMFLLIKFRHIGLLKLWFLAAIAISLTVAFFPLILKLLSLIFALIALPKIFSINILSSVIAITLAVLIAVLKVFKPTIIIQNTAELFIYGGLVAIFVSLFKNPQWGIFWAFVLLLIISIYDMVAVWKTKHMVSLAKFQAELKIFAGLSIPYKKTEKTKRLKPRKAELKTAILGGGDIAFPLIFAGAVMQKLMITNSEWIGFLKALIIPVFTTAALLVLLLKSKENKFYPAMPFLSLGCFIGYLVILVL